MRYKQTLKRIIADMLWEKSKAHPEYVSKPVVIKKKSIFTDDFVMDTIWKNVPEYDVPKFWVVDTPEQEHFGIMLFAEDEGYFKRKAGMYGLTWTKGLMETCGDDKNEYRVFSVHIVEEKDCVDSQVEQNDKELAKEISVLL